MCNKKGPQEEDEDQHSCSPLCWARGLYLCYKGEKRLQVGGGQMRGSSAHGPDMGSSTRGFGREKTCLTGCWRLSALGE